MREQEHVRCVNRNLLAFNECFCFAFPFQALVVFLAVGCLKIHLEKCGVQIGLVILFQVFCFYASFEKRDELLRMVNKRRKGGSGLGYVVFRRRIIAGGLYNLRHACSLFVLTGWLARTGIHVRQRKQSSEILNSGSSSSNPPLRNGHLNDYNRILFGPEIASVIVDEKLSTIF